MYSVSRTFVFDKGCYWIRKVHAFQLLWQSVTHMLTIGIGVISSSHVDMVSQVVDIHRSTSPAFIVRIQHWGIGIRSRRSAVRSPTTFICCPAVYDSSENQDDFGYRPLNRYHKRLAERWRCRVQIERLQLQACNAPDPSLLRRGSSQSIPTPWRPSIFFLIRQSHKGLYT